jgi:hypothetical protein
MNLPKLVKDDKSCGETMSQMLALLTAKQKKRKTKRKTGRKTNT